MNAEEIHWITSALNLIHLAIRLIPKAPQNRTPSDEEALTALSDAYHTTLEYYEFLKTNQRDSAKEVGIAHKWQRVGILLKKYDPTIAERLDAKSRYWRDGGTWSEDTIRKAGIGLEHIRREVILRVQ